jgi:cation diffusion facilitator CzcD-associated flavoprotein CzcO
MTPPRPADAVGLPALERRVARDLRLISYPEIDWVPRRTTADGRPLLDVLVVGAGQGGLALLWQLKRERVPNVAAIDRKPAGREGIWLDFARMKTLRSWKTVNGPDLDVPSLTFQSWFEAQHGAEAFEALGKIAKEDWQAYLGWLRRVLDLPVRNGVELVRVVPADGHLEAEVLEDGRPGRIAARKVVLATGIDGSGRWWMPDFVEALPRRLRAHTADPIDFAALAGKHVLVLGAGASAFDNAATALEAGAAKVTLCCRRPELQRVQPYRQISYNGFLRHFRELDDGWRWRFMNRLLSTREAFPRETWERASRHRNFELRTGCPWLGAEAAGDRVRVETPHGTLEADFAICGTGFDMDLSRRPELAAFADRIATWGDRYAPPPGEENPRLARYPYLDPGFAFTEKEPGTAPFLKDVHVFTFGATVSFGPSGSSINAMKFSAPRLVGALTRDLFLADAAHHYAGLEAYDTPEFDLPAEAAE